MGAISTRCDVAGSTLADRLVQPHVAAMQPYVPGAQPLDEGWVKLNTNENPYPPCESVIQAVQAECSKLRLYPNPASQRLRETIARRFETDADSVIIGNGSDDLLNLFMRAFCGSDRAAGWTVPSYSLYPVLAAACNVKLLNVPFQEDMSLPVREIVECGSNVFFLTSPNAPTGVGFSNKSIARILDNTRGILVVDEAYADFAEESATALLSDYDNVAVVRTFSKSYSLAGLRVGFALARPATIAYLDRIRDSYNVDRLAQAGALAALEGPDWLRETTNKIIATRSRSMQRFQDFGWHVYPSQANFLLVQPADREGNSGPQIAKSLFDFLYSHRILVRYLPGNPLTDAALRVSIGTDAQMDEFFGAIDTWATNA